MIPIISFAIELKWRQVVCSLGLNRLFEDLTLKAETAPGKYYTLNEPKIYLQKSCRLW